MTLPRRDHRYVHGARYQVAFDDGHRGRVNPSHVTTLDDPTVKRGVAAGGVAAAAPPIKESVWGPPELADGARRRRPKHNYLELLSRGRTDGAS